MANGSNHLTETILTLHNEVQAAVNNLETQARDNSEEVFLAVDKMHVKLPVVLDVEEGIESLEDADEELQDISSRKGFLVSDLGDGTGLFTKIRLTTVSSIDADPSLLGFVELQFTTAEK